MDVHFQKIEIPVYPSISYGVTETGSLPVCSVHDLLELADGKMYDMKNSRNKMWQQLIPCQGEVRNSAVFQLSPMRGI